jgi:hypothetical protein
MNVEGDNSSFQEKRNKSEGRRKCSFGRVKVKGSPHESPTPRMQLVHALSPSQG